MGRKVESSMVESVVQVPAYWQRVPALGPEELQGPSQEGAVLIGSGAKQVE